MECNECIASFIHFILLLVWTFLIHYTSSLVAFVFCVRYTWFCMTWWNEVKQCNLSEIKEDRIETIHLLYFGYFYTEEKNDQIRLTWILCFGNTMKIKVRCKEIPEVKNVKIVEWLTIYYIIDKYEHPSLILKALHYYLSQSCIYWYLIEYLWHWCVLTSII